MGKSLMTWKYWNNQIAYDYDIPAGIYLLKVNNNNTRTMFEICSK